MWRKLGFGPPSPPAMQYDPATETSVAVFLSYQMCWCQRIRAFFSGKIGTVTLVVLEGRDLKVAQPERINGSLTILPPW